MAASRGFWSLRSAAVATLPCVLLAIYPAILLPAAVNAQSASLPLIPCYYFSGGVSENNTKCPNSNSCCNAQATCLSNRLCHNAGDAPDVFVRGPCAVKPASNGDWDDVCAQICKYNETGFFPRVSPCADGSLCCSDITNCCSRGLGVFLDESGNVVDSKATAPTTSYVPVEGESTRSTVTPSTSTTSTSTTSTTSTTSESSSSSSESSTSSEPTSAATSSAQDTPAASSSDDSIGLKVGLGLGIPLAVLLTAIAVYFCLRKRGRAAAEDAAYIPDGSQYSPPSSTPGMVYTGVYNPAAPKYPVEMGNHTVSELDDGRGHRFELH